MKITFVLAVVVAVFLKESNQQCFPPFAGNQPNKNAHANLYAGQQEFSLALLNAINKLMPNENLFFSPYSTYHALLIAYFLSGGQTETYLKKVLRLKDDLEKSDNYAAYKLDRIMTQVLAKSAPYEFTNANKIYVEEEVPIRDCVANDFPDELERRSFKTNPEGARLYINNWVENTTHHMIKDLLPPGTIDQSTNLVLVNAAYFKGVWENKFPPEATKQEVFYVSPTKQIMVDMMHVEGSFKHDISESLGAHILELPYEGDNVKMLIFLPPWSDAEDSIETTLKNLNAETLKKVVDNNDWIPKTVQVALPKFSLETMIELTPILDSGEGNPFGSDADFSALTSEKMSIGEGIHKARIEINENGAHAAAATALVAWRMMPSEEDKTKFICNKPFIYMIYNGKTHTVMFVGVFRNPPSK
ncbi:serine protease inhibitor 88Ea isoform X1 [Leptinotarsa decemlineata]|uniref:serine protease inhibitor 88Ea isoform X1 n=1 Tax=Leptinotarsa decemlineata TaxID=7539 RepID=UPI000C251B2F|nr:serine protease inhibitor 88Ea-like isoform X1 [Leptinotarsa decemlineata]